MFIELYSSNQLPKADLMKSISLPIDLLLSMFLFRFRTKLKNPHKPPELNMKPTIHFQNFITHLQNQMSKSAIMKIAEIIT